MTELPRLRYLRPASVADALAALARPGACIYAGGTDLLPALADRRRWARFARTLVDVKGLAAARGIALDGAELRIGALTTAHELAAHPAVRRHAAVVAEAAGATSAPALRARGTVGGNLTTPHPAGDVTTALLALGARVEVADGAGIRTLALAGFLTGQAATWPHQQLVLAVRVRRAARSAFERVGARAGFSRARVAVAVAVVDRRVRIALGGLGARPFLAPPALVAARADDAALAAALAAECRPPARDAADRLALAAAVIRRACARVRA